MKNETGIPEDFTPQHIGIAVAKGLADLAVSAIVEYFRENPDMASRLLAESYDKRFTPSSFIAEEGERFKVGWFSRRCRYECVQEFATLADAATDYFLLSLGRGRWTPENLPNQGVAK